MTAAEILRERAKRFDYVVAFTPDEVLALASLVEAAERFLDKYPGLDEYAELTPALTALEEALGGDVT